jgi:Glycosyl transferase family 2
VDKLAPIALFIYNRPDHTRRTLAALAANPLAIESDLIVFADGPKKPEHANNVERARAVVRQAAGFRSVSLIEQGVNLGLAPSIIAGVTNVCESHGRAIVLEDDLVVSPGFLSYMNRALDRYANDDKVMQISGYMFPVARSEELPPTFFLKLSSTWGWATWQRAWSAFESDAEILVDRMRNANHYEFDVNGSYPYMATLIEQQRGSLNVWGVRWYASMFLRRGLCLHPAQSLVNNIGMDGSGEHCGPSNAFDVVLGSSAPRVFPDEIVPSAFGEAKIVEFFRKPKRSVAQRVVSRLGRILTRLTAS